MQQSCNKSYFQDGYNVKFLNHFRDMLIQPYCVILTDALIIFSTPFISLRVTLYHISVPDKLATECTCQIHT